MTGTGRLHGEIGGRTRRIIYGDLSPTEIETELRLMTRVDRAHLVMLAARGLIAPEAAAGLLRCVDDLAAEGFRSLAGRPAPRGLYLMYEGYLIERLGEQVGGILQTGRSRNDLKATMTSLRLRSWVAEAGAEAARLEAVLLARARAYKDTTMPAYTHYQAAMPVTYGYYLLGVALAVGRDIDALRAAAAGLSASPLGASAVAGTDLAIDPAMTARLLGFAAPARHAMDAVAGRDTALRLLAAAVALTVTLSRLATDLQLWSTAEFGLISFPDRLVGGSSAMPQKRNAFLLEHVKAKPAHVTGAFVAAAGAMAAAPYTNSIEVGTEAVAAVWPGLDTTLDAVRLAQVLVGGARPDPARMRRRAEEGFTAATSVANRLVRRGIPFRAAHHMVGDAVRRAIEAGSTRLADFGPPGWLDGTGLDGSGVVDADVGVLAGDHAYGGGPGAFDDAYAAALDTWCGHREWLAADRRAEAAAEAALAEAVGAALGREVNG